LGWLNVQAVGRIVERKPFSDKEYKQIWIYVPTKLAQSKTFPFVKGDEVLIVVDEKKRRLVVEKLEPRTV
jgi:hypothetical protein